MTNTPTLLEEMKERRNKYSDMLSTNMLSKCNTIVSLGFYTVSVDENDRTILVNAKYPTEFTPRAATKIKNECVFRNANGDRIMPELIPRNKWYQDAISNLDELIKIFEKDITVGPK